MFTFPQITGEAPRGTITTFTIDNTTTFGSYTWRINSLSTDGMFLALMDSVYMSGDIRIFLRLGQTFSYHSHINTTVPSGGDIHFALNSNGTRIAVLINNPTGNSTNLYVYNRSGTTWTQGGSVSIACSHVNGLQVVISDDGSKIIVSDPEFSLGRGKIFHFDGSLTPIVDFIVEDFTSGNYKYHGSGLTITGDGSVIALAGRGSYDYSVNAELRVFAWSGSAWVNAGTSTLVSSANMTGPVQTSRSISSTYLGSTGFSNCRIVVGVNDYADSSQSFVKIFYRNNAATLGVVSTVSLPANSVKFGHSVDINKNGTMVYISDPNKSYSGNSNVGTVYSWDNNTLVEYPPIDWQLDVPLFGLSISCDGDGTVLVVTGTFTRTSQFTLSL